MPLPTDSHVHPPLTTPIGTDAHGNPVKLHPAWFTYLNQLHYSHVKPSGGASNTLQGQFTATLFDNNGGHQLAQGTMQYRIVGPHGIVYSTINLLGTSTATDLTLTGLPTILQTPNSQTGICLLENNNVTVWGSFATNNTGTVTLKTLQTQAAGAGSNLIENANGFTASGTKGFVQATVMMFALV